MIKILEENSIKVPSDAWEQDFKLGATKDTWCSMFAQLYRQVHMVSP